MKLWCSFKLVVAYLVCNKRQERAKMHVAAFQALNRWFLSPQGKAVSFAFEEQLMELKTSLLDGMRGTRLLQLGACGHQPWLSLFQHTDKWIVSPSKVPGLSSSAVHYVLGLPRYLPFESASVDCIISPLALEACDWSHHPIDELDRVLKPMGYLIFFGVNALSLWGLYLRLGKLPYIPKSLMRPVSVFRLKQTLFHCGYSLCHLAPFYYVPPVMSMEWIKRLEIFNELGKMISLCPSGFYCMIVQKYVPDYLAQAAKQKYWQTVEGT